MKQAIDNASLLPPPSLLPVVSPILTSMIISRANKISESKSDVQQYMKNVDTLLDCCIDPSSRKPVVDVLKACKPIAELRYKRPQEVSNRSSDQKLVPSTFARRTSQDDYGVDQQEGIYYHPDVELGSSFKETSFEGADPNYPGTQTLHANLSDQEYSDTEYDANANLKFASQGDCTNPSPRNRAEPPSGVYGNPAPFGHRRSPDLRKASASQRP